MTFDFKRKGKMGEQTRPSMWMKNPSCWPLYHLAGVQPSFISPLASCNLDETTKEKKKKKQYLVVFCMHADPGVDFFSVVELF